MPKKQRRLNVGTIFLIILAIVIFVIIIVSKIVPTLDGDRPRIPIAKSYILATENLIIQYHVDTGFYPSTSEGLKVLMERPSGPAGVKWNGPYARTTKFTDGWGYDLHYQCPGAHNPDSYDLWSYGADGKKGGKGKDADYGNW